MFSGPLFADQWVLKLIQAIGVLLGVWAIFVMRIGNFNITPTPVRNGVFISAAPYSVLRHPMYTSIFIFVIPELMNGFIGLRISAFAILVITLIFKMNYEEKQLVQQFDEYSSYKKNTKRIIPFIY